LLHIKDFFYKKLWQSYTILLSKIVKAGNRFIQIFNIEKLLKQLVLILPPNFKTMTRYFLAIISIAFILFFSACSTEVDNYAEYKDITIVYGILETGVDTTFIKITKAFLGPGNALLFARNPDSSNYAGKLNVSLLGRRNSVDLPAITLDTITKRNKLAGDSIFYFPEQKLYYTTTPLVADAAYTLVVDKGDNEIRSSTTLVKEFSIQQPINRINFAATVPTPIRWSSAESGKRYEVSMKFFYRELHPGNPDTISKSLTWFLGTRKSNSLSGGETLEITYLGETFYNLLGNQLSSGLNIKRFAGNVDVVISSGGDDLSTYIDVNAPSNSIVMEIPEFTNIENGYGIFSSRKTISRNYRLSVQSEVKLVEDFNWGFVLNR
jgi:hypothetical protein